LAGAKHTPRNFSHIPSAEMLEQAQKIIDVFAKDDVVTRLDGIHRGNQFIVMEIEKIEPYLYPNLTENFGEKYAAALIAKLGWENRTNGPERQKILNCSLLRSFLSLSLPLLRAHLF
jgi:hypothetical protein